MSDFQRGQIWLVNFDPSFGHEYKKIRPSLIVQNDRYKEVNDRMKAVNEGQAKLLDFEELYNAC